MPFQSRAKTKRTFSSRIATEPHSTHLYDFKIDEEFKDIIEKQCPGKLYKMLRRRMKKRITTEPTLCEKPEHPSQIQIFERTFYKEQRKSKQTTERKQMTKQKLQVKLGMMKKEPMPFFEINRRNILSLEKAKVSVHTPRSRSFGQQKEIKVGSSQIIHPYLTISEKMSKMVCKRRSEFNSRRFLELSPFDNIEPIYLGD